VETPVPPPAEEEDPVNELAEEEEDCTQGTESAPMGQVITSPLGHTAVPARHDAHCTMTGGPGLYFHARTLATMIPATNIATRTHPVTGTTIDLVPIDEVVDALPVMRS